MRKYLFALVIAWSMSLEAEVQKVVLKWNAALCQDTCVPLMQRQLQAIPGIANFQINAGAGIADIDWKPDAPFSFYPFNTATRSVGARLLDVRVKVKGTIVYDSQNLYLVSLGDNSRFILLGPLGMQSSQFVMQANPANHPLPADIKENLIEASRKHQTVTIEGPLFEPERYNLSLITEKIDFPKEEPRDYQRRGQPIPNPNRRSP